MGIFDKIDEGILGKLSKDDADAKEAPPSFSDTTSSSSTVRGDSPKADFSDVTAGESSTAPSAGGRTYVVKSGDSLSRIAKSIYGDGNAWHRIYDANRDTIKDPDLIHPGQELTIPDA